MLILSSFQQSISLINKNPRPQFYVLSDERKFCNLHQDALDRNKQEFKFLNDDGHSVPCFWSKSKRYTYSCNSLVDTVKLHIERLS